MKSHKFGSKEQSLLKIKGLKGCQECGEILNIKKFSKKGKLKRRARCGPCYYKVNREKIRERVRRYEENNNILISKKKSEYYINNKERINNYTKIWKLNNKDKVRALNAIRRAGKLQRTPTWLSEEHKQLIGEFYKQSYDVTKSTGVLHHVDHIIPLKGKTVSGLHVPWNLQILTAEENMKKGNRL